MIDFSKMSTPDLEALANGNMQAMSTPGLQMIAGGASNNTPSDSANLPSFQSNNGSGLLQDIAGIGKHLLADSATAGRNTLNAIGNPSTGIGIANVLNQVPGLHGISDVTNQIPGIKNMTVPQINKNYNYYDALGINQNIPDEIGVGALSYAPYALGAESGVAEASKLPAISNFLKNSPKLAKFLPSLAENTAGGATSAASNSSPGNAMWDGLMGGLTGGAATVAGAGLSGLGGLATKIYAQSAIPSFISRSTDYLRNLIDQNGVTNKLSNKYLAKNAENKNNWENVKNIAQDIDQKNMVPKIKPPISITVPGGTSNQKFENLSLNDLLSGKIPTIMRGKDFSSIPSGKVGEVDGYGLAGLSPKFNNYDFSADIKPDNSTVNMKVSSPSQKAEFYKLGTDMLPERQLQPNFDNSAYHNYIDNFQNKVLNLDPAQQEQYKQALVLSNKARDLAPQSLSGMIASRQNINKDMADYLNENGMTSANMQSKAFLSGLKDNLKNEVLNSNSKNMSPEDFSNLKNAWEKANQSHQDLKEFYKAEHPSTGIMADTNQMTDRFKNLSNPGATLNPSVFSEYSPTFSQDASQGVEGVNHLGKLLGDDDLAKKAVTAHIFRRQTDQGANTLDAAALYSKLSPIQRETLLGNTPAGNMLGLVERMRQEHGKEPARNFWQRNSHSILGMGLPGLAGAFAAHENGANWEGTLMGGAAAAAASHLGAKALGWSATPRLVTKALERANKGVKHKGRYLNMIAQQNFMNGVNQ